MLIAILVLLGIAGAIWYFARQQTQTVTLSQEDVAASTPSFDETEAKLKEAQQAALKIDKKLDKMTKKIDEALAAVPAPEVTAPKVEVVEEKAPEPVVEATPATPVVEAAPVVEAPKPAKKKRRYYPKKK
jgi:cytoskeletal protein RodZ